MRADAPRLYFTCLGGLEPLVVEELAERLPTATVAATEFGRVRFHYAGPVSDLLGLRTVEHLHVRVRELQNVRPERGWLAEIEAILADTDLDPALALRRQVTPLPEAPSFRVTGERHGNHEFRSMEMAARAGAGVVARYGWRVDLEGYDLDVRVEVRQDQGLIGLRVSPEALHHRSRIVHMRASLNPTLAAAMVRASQPAPGETVLDPMCGAGTLLTERHQYAPDAYLLAGDRHAEKLALAQTNFAHFGVPAHLVQADATTLPWRTGHVDKVLCNLPWGRVVANPKVNRRLYPALLAEMARVLRPGGRAVLLTSERNLTSRVLAETGAFTRERDFHVHVGGLEPTLYVVRRG